MTKAFYQYSDGSYHKAGEAIINKESFIYPIRIPGLKPVCKFVLKQKKKHDTSGVIQETQQE